MDSKHPTQPPQASTGADGTPEALLAQLYKRDVVLAHFIEIILKLQETQPDLAYGLEYLLFANEGQRHTARAWFRLIDSAKKREKGAAPTQPDTQGP